MLDYWNQMNHPQKIIDKFFKSINYPGNDFECWLWMKDLNFGYGIFHINQIKKVRAHRFIYECYYGPIPPGLLVMHSCDNPRCCNPEHLSIGTTQDNVDDKIRKNCQAVGSKNGFSTLTEDEIIDILEGIKNDKFKTRSQICQQYSISNQTIYMILNRKRWQHVTNKYTDLELKQLISMINQTHKNY